MSCVEVSDAAKPGPCKPPITHGGLRAFTQRHATLASVALLCLGTFALYSQSLKNGFVNYDDPAYVSHNLQTQKGLTWPAVAWAFSSTSEANWHPLTWMSHMADVSLYRLHPAGHPCRADRAVRNRLPLAWLGVRAKERYCLRGTGISRRSPNKSWSERGAESTHDAAGQSGELSKLRRVESAPLRPAVSPHKKAFDQRSKELTCNSVWRD